MRRKSAQFSGRGISVERVVDRKRFQVSGFKLKSRRVDGGKELTVYSLRFTVREDSG